MPPTRSEEHTSELQSRENLVCRLLLEKKKYRIERASRRRRRRRSDRRRRLRRRSCESPAAARSRSHRNRCRNPRAALPFFFFNDTRTTEIYTLSLHDALPISGSWRTSPTRPATAWRSGPRPSARSTTSRSEEHTSELQSRENLVCRLLLE